MIKIFNNPNDRLVNNFLKKSKGTIKHYGNPLIIEYNEKDFEESYHTCYEIEAVIFYGIDSVNKFIATDVLAPKSKKHSWIFINKFSEQFELKEGVECSVDFRTAEEMIYTNNDNPNVDYTKTYFWFGTSDFQDGTRFENYPVEEMLRLTKCVFND